MEFRSQEWGVAERLLTGALAALTATTVTHPLDVIRVRIATQPELRGIGHAASSMVAEGGARVFYKGYVPTVLSLTPFISINFATFDYMKSSYMEWRKAEKIGSVPTLAMGAASGLIAQTVPHPDGLGLGSWTSCAIQCLSILLPLPLMSARPDRTNSILVET